MVEDEPGYYELFSHVPLCMRDDDDGALLVLDVVYFFLHALQHLVSEFPVAHDKTTKVNRFLSIASEDQCWFIGRKEQNNN